MSQRKLHSDAEIVLNREDQRLDPIPSTGGPTSCCRQESTRHVNPRQHLPQCADQSATEELTSRASRKGSFSLSTVNRYLPALLLLLLPPTANMSLLTPTLRSASSSTHTCPLSQTRRLSSTPSLSVSLRTANKNPTPHSPIGGLADSRGRGEQCESYSSTLS
jgi:hypothetical protein